MKTVLYILLAILVVSCNPKIYDKNIQVESIVFPSEPDTPRIQYLTKISSSEDVLKPNSKFTQFIFGKRAIHQIIKPYGIYVKNSKIYITDAGILGLTVIDLENKKYNKFIPTGRGGLRKPINCFVDNSGKLYVSDSQRNQVVIFDEDYKFITAIGDTGNFKPTDVFVYNNNIYVANIKNHKINVYSNDSIYKLLLTFPDSEYGNDDFLYQPGNLFVSDDKIYVSDLGGYDVKVFSVNGEYLRKLGVQGKSPGQFTRNKGVAVDHDGNVYVVDAAFENVQIFNDNGQLLMSFGGPYSGPGYLWLPAKVAIDYDNLEYFQQYVNPKFDLKYLIFVTNQYGPDKITVYGRVELKK